MQGKTETLQTRTQKRNENYKIIFRNILFWYLELSSIDGTRSSKTTTDNFLLFSFPTICEFIADIDIAFKESLTKEELELLSIFYLTLDNHATIRKYTRIYGEEFIKDFCENLEIKMGKVFKKKGIHPIKKYLNSTIKIF